MTAVLIGTATSAQAAGTDQTTFLVRQGLTPGTELRGSVAFTTPDGWRATNRSERHTAARFKVAGPGGCSLDLQVGVRGVVTASSPSSQVARAVGDASLGRGNKRGREWGSTGPSLSGGEGEPQVAGIYGIAPIRVRSNRYGQIRVISLLQGCAADSSDAVAFLAPGGATVKAVNHLLANARPTYRVVKSPRS